MKEGAPEIADQITPEQAISLKIFGNGEAAIVRLHTLVLTIRGLPVYVECWEWGCRQVIRT